MDKRLAAFIRISEGTELFQATRKLRIARWLMNDCAITVIHDMNIVRHPQASSISRIIQGTFSQNPM